MQKCIVCEHWYEDDQFDNDLAVPTCNGCAAGDRNLDFCEEEDD